MTTSANRQGTNNENGAAFAPGEEHGIRGCGFHAVIAETGKAVRHD